VEGGDLEARAEFGEALHHLQTLLRVLGERALGRHEEVGVGALRGAADATAELVELRESQRVGAVDEDGVGVGDVQPALHDRGAQEHVDLAVDEAGDHLLQGAFGDRKSTRLNSSHVKNSYAVLCLKKKTESRS